MLFFVFAKLSGQATITLKVASNASLDETGFQMLLDADHITLGPVIPWLGVNLPFTKEAYDKFEYKIPANASSESFETGIINNGNEVSIQIPAGYYDYAIVRPNGAPKAPIVTGAMSFQNNFRFEDGYTYEFNINSTGLPNAVSVLRTPYDGALSNITVPISSISLGSNENITVAIKNNSTSNPISGFPVKYRLNDGAVVTENYTGTIASGTTANYTFATKADFSQAGAYFVKSWVELPQDYNRSNDTIRAAVTHPGVFTLPFKDGFNSENQLTFWNIVDKNAGSTWAYNSYTLDASDGFGTANIKYNAQGGNDYLVTKNPIHLTNGRKHFLFDYKAESTAYPQGFRILYGTSSDPTTMQELVSVSGQNNINWKKYILNFEQTIEGDYYFAIHSNSAFIWSFMIDNVVIDNDFYYEGIPNLELKEIVPPYISCSLNSNEKIGLKVYNSGNAPVQKFYAKYQINSGTWITEEFTMGIPALESRTVFFNTTTDMSQVGKYYINAASYLTDENNAATLNDYAVHLAPLSSILPYVADFNTSSARSQWAAISEKDWQVLQATDGTSIYAAVRNGTFDNKGLVSSCISLEPGTYRYTMDYIAGSRTGGASFVDNFFVALGNAGTDPESWNNYIVDINGANTNTLLETISVNFTIAQPGLYAFNISPKELGLSGLAVAKVKIDKVIESDIATKSIYSSLGSKIPKGQISGAQTIEASVKNIGTSNVDAVRSIAKIDAQTIKESDVYQLAANQTTTIDLGSSLGQLATGTHSLTVESNIVGQTELNPADNTLGYTFDVTENIFATDRLSNFADGVGSTLPISLGNIYKINKATKLKGVDIGFSDLPNAAGQSVKVAVYKTNDLTSPIVQGTFLRPSLEGFITVDLSATLEEGTYLVEVTQNTSTNFGLVYDKQPGGLFYMRQNSTALQTYKNSSYGNIAIRMIIDDSAMGVDDIKKIDIQFYPNPVVDFVNIINEEPIQSVNIFDISGKMVYTSKENAKAVKLDLSGLISGTYVINAVTEKGVKTFKIIKK